MKVLGMIELTEVGGHADNGDGWAPEMALNADECDITDVTGADFSSSDIWGDNRWFLAVVEFINDALAQLFNIAVVDIIGRLNESIFNSFVCCCCCCC